MDKQDLPMGFGFALAQNPDAMQRFARLSPSQRSEVLQKARSASSKREMQSLVNSLSTCG